MKKSGIIFMSLGLFGTSFVILSRLVEGKVLISDQRYGILLEFSMVIIGLAIYLWPEKK